jgi:hypothetical protein
MVSSMLEVQLCRYFWVSRTMVMHYIMLIDLETIVLLRYCIVRPVHEALIFGSLQALLTIRVL